MHKKTVCSIISAKIRFRPERYFSYGRNQENALPRAVRAVYVLLRRLRGRGYRRGGYHPESRRDAPGAGSNGNPGRTYRTGELYRRYHYPGLGAVRQSRRETPEGLPEKRHLRMQKFHCSSFPPEPGQVPDGGIPGPAAENPEQPAGKAVQALLLRLLLGRRSRLQRQSLYGSRPVPVRLQAEQGGEPRAGAGFHEAGAARGLFPDDRRLQRRQRGAQRHLHLGLRSGNQHRPLHGQQPERQAHRRHPLRLCAV